MSYITLDRKYGVNPTMTQCFFCGEAKDILLIGAKTAKFKEAGLCSADGEMNHMIGAVDYEPCQKCKELMEKGVMMISVRDGESGKNPYRTGKIAVVTDEAVAKIVHPKELAEDILKKRVCFVPDAAWEMLGLPEENIG